MSKVTIESEHSFAFYIQVEAHGHKASVVLERDASNWRMASYGEPKLDKWVGASRLGYPAALERALVELELYLSIKERKAS
jgi:regulation of enolase protein 1 (concanavalin A-like superfamily)